MALLTDKQGGSSTSYDVDKQSDHLIMMVAYMKWEKILREVCISVICYVVHGTMVARRDLYLKCEMLFFLAIHIITNPLTQACPDIFRKEVKLRISSAIYIF